MEITNDEGSPQIEVVEGDLLQSPSSKVPKKAKQDNNEDMLVFIERKRQQWQSDIETMKGIGANRLSSIAE